MAPSNTDKSTEKAARRRGDRPDAESRPTKTVYISGPQLLQFLACMFRCILHEILLAALQQIAA